MSGFSYSTSPSMEDYINRLNNMKATPTVQTPSADITPVSTPAVDLEEKPDVVEISTKKEYDGPKIGMFRVLLGRLTNEQINAVNESRRLPENVKINKYKNLKNNFFNITEGTRTLPEGYELRNNKFGFTRMVLIDSEGFLLKKKPGGDAEARIEAKKEAKAEKKAAKMRKKGIMID